MFRCMRADGWHVQRRKNGRIIANSKLLLAVSGMRTELYNVISVELQKLSVEIAAFDTADEESLCLPNFCGRRKLLLIDVIGMCFVRIVRLNTR